MEGDSLWLRFRIDDEYISYIVPKGFIAIDGTSLTVCEVHKMDTKVGEDFAADNVLDSYSWFTVMLVPHTQQNIILPQKEIGDAVNIEVDVLGKLVVNGLHGTLEEMRGNMRSLEKTVKEQQTVIESLQDKVARLSKRVD
jgi:riboflavin synthase